VNKFHWTLDVSSFERIELTSTEEEDSSFLHVTDSTFYSLSRCYKEKATQ